MKEQIAELTRKSIQYADLHASVGEWGEVERRYFAILVRNAALEQAKQLFPQPHQEYFGREAQDALESLKEPTP